MEIPKLNENKCSILFAEFATGHVFKKDLTIFQDGQNQEEVFQLFDNFQIAKEFAINFVRSNPEFECSIYDYSGKHLTTIDKNGEKNRSRIKPIN